MRMRISEYSSARVPFVTTKLRKYLQEPGSGETSSFNCEEERILKKQSNDVFVFGDVRRTNVVLVLERNHIRMRIHPYSNSRVPCVTKLRKFLQEPGSGETSSYNCEEERILKKQSNTVFVFADVRRTTY
jgi:hypothetical protein